MNTPRLAWWILLPLTLALLGLVLVATAIGSVSVPLGDTAGVILARLGFPAGWLPPPDQKWDAIIFLVRLPRVLGAVVIGAALAVAGTVMQGLLRNPLADPGLIGVSSGAGFGAVLSIALGVAATSAWALPVFASLGSLTAAGIIFVLAIRAGKMGLFTLILAGIAVSTFFGAGTSLVLTFASHDSIAQFLFWSMGNLYNVRWESLGLVILPIGTGVFALLWFTRDLNVLLLGEEEAQAVGVDVFRTRLILLVLVSAVTASAVCISGPISFVGLIVPHILRLLLGPDHRLLVPAAALGGAAFLVICDLVARMALGAQEINVGIVTALVGAPYFLFLLLRSVRRGGTL
ncbi:MAG: iron chelate uptake ABC transporter family permease subunit [Spirochaetales bacterium]